MPRFLSLEDMWKGFHLVDERSQAEPRFLSLEDVIRFPPSL